VVYARTLEGEVLDFGHSGLLYRSAFLLYDRRTNSLWHHATGQALAGKLRGKRLAPLPSRFVRWSVWQQAWPRSLVLPKDPREPAHMKDAYRDRNLALKLAFGLGVRAGDDDRLYELAELARTPFVQERVGGVPVAVLYHAPTETAVAWERTLDGEVLELQRAPDGPEQAPRISRETPTGTSVFDAVTGECLAGPLKGKRLVPVLSSHWEVYAWMAHHPRGSAYRASVPPPPELPPLAPPPKDPPAPKDPPPPTPPK